MNLDLLQRQQQELEAHFLNRKQTLEKVIALEKYHRAGHTAADGQLGQRYQDILQFSRADWLQEWGADGRQARTIQERHHKEETALAFLLEANADMKSPVLQPVKDLDAFDAYVLSRGFRPDRPTEAELDDMYQAAIADTKEDRAVNKADDLKHPVDGSQAAGQEVDDERFTRYINEQARLGKSLRENAWQELTAEQEAVTGFFENSDMPVPAATQRRLQKQQATFQMRWGGGKIDPSAADWVCMDDYDLASERHSLEELQTAHRIVRRHYEGQTMPDPAKERMADDTEDYKRELQAYRERDNIQAEPEKNTLKSDFRANQTFREQLESLRQRAADQLRHKGPKP